MARFSHFAPPNSKVYVGNLPYGTTNRDLAELFEPIGRVRGATILVNPDDGTSRGVGFVSMVEPDDCAKAIAQLDQTEFGERRIKVAMARTTRS